MTNLAQNMPNSQVQPPVIKFDENEMLFTHEEMNFLRSNFENIVLTMDNGMPFINYEVAKSVFEKVVGNNYNIEILHYEYMENLETFLAHVRITISRRGKTVKKEVIGCEKAKKKKNSQDILNFDNLPKSAVKDAIKKFLSDYIGIGSTQYNIAKKAYEAKNKNNYNNNYNNSYNNNNNNNNTNTNGQQNANTEYKCSEPDCGRVISEKVYNWSKNYHSQKRPLCPNCQKKYQ